MLFLAVAVAVYALSFTEIKQNKIKEKAFGAAPISGLVGYWNFDEGTGTTAADSSGNGYNGTLYGPTWTVGRFGNGALSFNNSSVDLPTISIPSDITVSAWVYSSDFNQNGVIVQKHPTLYQWSLFFEGGALKWRGNYTGRDISCSLPSNNNWHQVIATKSGTDSKIYLDGTLCGSGQGDAIANGTGVIRIGSMDTRDNYYEFNGKIDEVRIYNRALAGSEITDLFNDTGSGLPQAPTITSFTSSVPSVPSGNPVTLSWNTSAATSVSISPGNFTSNSGSGSTTFSPTQSTTYTLTATNSGGSTTATVTVSVTGALPRINSFNALPTGITVGGDATLSWNITGADSVSINNGPGNQSSTASGQVTVSPNQTTVYTLTASNTNGTVSTTTVLSVTPVYPSGTAVLDDFSQGIRKNGAGSNLWDVYLGDCDTPQSMNIIGNHLQVVGDNTYGAFDRGCGGGHGNGIYFHFYPYPYTQPNGHVQDWLTSGSKNANYNRFSFKMKCTKDTLQSDTTDYNLMGEPILSLGTYVKTTADNNAGSQGDHFYHGLGFNIYANQWSTMVYNRTVTHWRDNPGYMSYPEDPLWFADSARKTHYYDGLTRWYFDSASNNTQSSQQPVAPYFRTPPTMDSWSGQNCEYSDFIFWYQTDEPDPFVYTLNGTYNGSGYELSFDTVKNYLVNYDVKYATQDIKTLGWSNASNGGSVANHRTSSVSVTWKGPSMSEQPDMWLAVRPRMNIQSISGSPMVVSTIQDTFLSTGDTVNISGVTGCTAANGNWTVTSIPRTSFSSEDGQLLSFTTNPSGDTTFTTASPHGLAVGRLVSMYQTDQPYTFGPTPITSVTATTFTAHTGMPAATVNNPPFLYVYSAIQLNNSSGCNTPYLSDGTVTATSENKNFTEIHLSATASVASAGDTTPPVISSVSAGSITSSAASISWTTDEQADTQVEYGTTSSYGQTTTLNSSLSTSHSATLSSLSSSTLYHYRVKSRDGSGNLSVSTDNTFTTTSPLPTLPQISNLVGSNITSSSAQFTWTTNIPTNAQIFYGTTSSYGFSSALQDDSLKTTSHSLSISSLLAATAYHFKATSIDALGNSTSTADFSFTTLSVSNPTNSGGSGGASGGSSGSGGGGSSGGTTTPTSTQPIVFIPPVSVTPGILVPTSSLSISQQLRLINNKGTYYLIKNNERHGIANPGILYTYGFTFSHAQTATDADLQLPEGSLLTPEDGSLVKSKEDKTVYLISGQRRYGFVSEAVFKSLGFKFSSVIVVTNPELQILPVDEPLKNPSAAHMPGLDVKKNGTIYWVGYDGKLYPYPSLEVFNSWRIPNDFSKIVPANAADLNLPIGDNVAKRLVN